MSTRNHTQRPTPAEGFSVVFVCEDCTPIMLMIMSEDKLNQSAAMELLFGMKAVAATEEDPETKCKLITDMLTR